MHLPTRLFRKVKSSKWGKTCVTVNKLLTLRYKHMKMKMQERSSTKIIRLNRMCRLIFRLKRANRALKNKVLPQKLQQLLTVARQIRKDLISESHADS